MSKLTLRAQTVDIAYLPLHKDFLAKNVLMTAQRDFRLGNSPFLLDSFFVSISSNVQQMFLDYCEKAS
jgi:hypothetical protein